MEEYIEAHARLDEVTGDVVTLVAFDYEHEPVIRDLHDVQHAFQDVITTTSHMHADDWCLETLSVAVRPSESAISSISSGTSME